MGENIKLRQKIYGESKKFVLEDEEIKIRTVKSGKFSTSSIRYDEIGWDIETRVSTTRNNEFYVPAFGAIAGLYMLVYVIINDVSSSMQLLLWVMIMAYMSWLLYKSLSIRNLKYIYLKGTRKELELLASKPNPDVVTAFINEIHNRKKAKTKNTYLWLLENNYLEAEEQEEWLEYLLSIKAITEQEKGSY